jgi:putative transposon-encoded protein
MVYFESKITKIGNSHYVLIPCAFIEHLIRTQKVKVTIEELHTEEPEEQNLGA